MKVMCREIIVFLRGSWKHRIYPVDRTKNLLMLNLVVHKIPTGPYMSNALLFGCSYNSSWYAWQSANAFARASMSYPFAQCTARLYSVRWPFLRVLCFRSALSRFVLQDASLCRGLPWYRMDSQSRRAGHCRPIDCLTHWLPHTETRLNDSRLCAGESFVCWSFTFLHNT